MILVTGILAQAMEAFGQRLPQQGLWLKLAAGATWHAEVPSVLQKYCAKSAWGP